MKLSIIVPVYNMAAEDKLKHCLDSLVGQTLRGKAEYEIICVDDASTDDSLQILRDYEARFPEMVRVYANERNLRQGGAKNRGLLEARGEWIGFIDSDDWVSAGCYERLLAKAEQAGADMVGCNYCLVSEYTLQPTASVVNGLAQLTGPIDAERHKQFFLRPGSMVLKLYRADVIREHGLCFPEQIFYEDNCAGSIWSLYFTHYEHIDEPLYFYYQHASSTVHYISEEKCNDRKRAMELLYEACRERGYLEAYHAELEYRFAELYYVVTLFSYLQGAEHPTLSYVRALREGVEQYFPTFRENPYYLKYTGTEERKWIALQQKSDFLFFYEYRLKLWVRRLRTGRGK